MFQSAELRAMRINVVVEPSLVLRQTVHIRTWGALPFYTFPSLPPIPLTLARVAFPSSILRPDAVPFLVEMFYPLGFRPLGESQHIVEIHAQRTWPRSPFTVSFVPLDNLCLDFLAVLLN